MVQARDVHGGVHFHGRDRGQGPVPRQLPADVRGFVNRLGELDRLDRVLTGDLDEPLAVRFVVIAGTAGVGKTSLALHWAHRVRERFPDGQLYANLRGYDPGPPVAPEQALDHFLRTLEVPPEMIPRDLDARAALYRSMLAGRRMLVILDNAATAGQVRPLLPGTADCLAVVTSRSRLSGLVFRDGAHRVTLDVLTETEAVALLRTVTSGYRPEDDPEELVELARLCARLPLALRIAAERAARRPGSLLNELIDDLRDESGLWDALSSGDDEEADAVRTVFAWSYRALPAESARLFRLLGLHPGPEFSAAAAAALAGVATGQVRNLLDVLVGAHLIEQCAPGRYQFHDLLRVYATEQARLEETPETCLAALRRAVGWYLSSVDAAQAVLSPHEPRLELGPLEPGVRPAPFGGVTDVVRWYEAERPNFVAATRAAADAGLLRTTWQLAAVLRNLYMFFNPFEDWFTTTRIGLAAARDSGDRHGEAELVESLAIACVQAHRLDEGADRYRETLALRRELGDRLGELLALNGLGLVGLRRRRLDDARASFEESLTVARAAGANYWETVVTGNLGRAYCGTGDLQTARSLLQRSLDGYRAEGDRLGEGDVLASLSLVHRESGNPAEAARAIGRALAIAREDGNTVLEGFWLLEFAQVQRALGEPEDALVAYQRCATLHRQLRDRSREARALDGAGETYGELGRFEDAAGFHRLAVAAHRDLDDRWQLANALENLATVLQHTGSPGDARQCREEARACLAGFEDVRAARLRQRIDEALT